MPHSMHFLNLSKSELLLWGARTCLGEKRDDVYGDFIFIADLAGNNSLTAEYKW